SEGSQARRSADRAADKIRAGGQPQDCQVSRDCHPRVGLAARGRGHSVSETLVTVRGLIIAVVIITTLPSWIAHADQSLPVHRIGVLTAPVAKTEEALRDGLRELGYIEGKNVIIDWRRSLGTDEE